MIKLNELMHSHTFRVNADCKLFKKLAYVHDLASQTPPLFEIDGRVPIARMVARLDYKYVPRGLSYPAAPPKLQNYYTYRVIYMLTVHICMIREKLFALIIMSLQTAVTSFTTPRYLLLSLTVF